MCGDKIVEANQTDPAVCRNNSLDSFNRKKLEHAMDRAWEPVHLRFLSRHMTNDAVSILAPTNVLSMIQSPAACMADVDVR
jgi:hypothetical protein